jgi:superfamily II DNA/RNA helicase
LILVPTRELATQVAADIRSFAGTKNLRIATVYGGTAVMPQAKKAKDAHVIVATPGRLHDLIERRLISLQSISILVLDEADRMLDMGFKPQVDRILRSVPTNRQTMLFSATFDGAVKELARNYTVTPSHVKGDLPAEAERGEIEHTFVSVTADTKLNELVERLRAVESGLALVFVKTKHGADKLARKLERQHDIPAVTMHGNMSQNQRERSLHQFETGRVSTLVATDVAACGLDVDDITHVINFDPPHGDNDYVHRVGRAGRSGTGVAGPTGAARRRKQARNAARARGPVRRVRHAGRAAAAEWRFSLGFESAAASALLTDLAGSTPSALSGLAPADSVRPRVRCEPKGAALNGKLTGTKRLYRRSRNDWTPTAGFSPKISQATSNESSSRMAPAIQEPAACVARSAFASRHPWACRSASSRARSSPSRQRSSICVIQIRRKASFASVSAQDNNSSPFDASALRLSNSCTGTRSSSTSLRTSSMIRLTT